MNKIKSTKGITLIALVVTIVILLILAGITITILFGDNGIIKRANAAKTKTEKAQQDDQDNLKNLENQMNNVIAGGGTGGPVDLASITSTDHETKKAKDTYGNIVTVPKGFKVVNKTEDPTIICTGEVPTVKEGVVIQDADGNQFVWIPVDGTSLKYEKHSYANPEMYDISGSTADTGNGGWRTYHYRWYNDWVDNEGDSTSVEKYKGFYLARYEAGIRQASTGTTDYTYTSYTSNSTNNNIDSKKPLSKKNCEAWNGINAVNAKTVAEKMYEGNTAVKSKLVDSRAWDTVTQWLSNTGHDVTDGTSWGNYYNNGFQVTGFYANHTYDGGWTVSGNWTYGNNFSKPASNETYRYELLTGAVERNKANNIYDFSGNMYEWTTETRGSGWGAYSVVRGGSFYSKAYDPASYRRGNIGANVTNPDVGFRVVLYIAGGENA